MKRVTIIGLLLGLLILTGCRTAGAVQQEAAFAREELVLWSYYETDKQQTALDELTEGFNKAQERYHLTWEYHGPATEFNKRLAIGITQDQLPDMVILDNPDMPRYIAMDRFEDITESVLAGNDTESYFPNVLESVEYNGRFFGMPFCCNNVALIYNKDILKEEGLTVPTSWEELLETAVALSTPQRQGFAMCAVKGEQGAFQTATFMLSAGDTLQEAGGDGTKRTFELMEQLVMQGALSKDCINWSQNDVARIFIAGKCAMMENGPWVFPALEASGINYGVANFPRDVTYGGVVGGENLAVLKGKNVEGSIAFMDYYSKREVMLNINLRANSLPPKQDVAKLFLNIKPEYEVIMDQMDQCVSRTGYDKWLQLSAALSEAQYRVITGEITPQEACDMIRQQIQ